MFRQFADAYLRGLADCHREIPHEKLENVVEILLRAHQHRRKVFILGNGGSAATASHMACDFGKGTAIPGKPRLRVISLVDNMALLSAWANDSGYEVIFREQLENLMEPGDVVLGISASGNSPNVLRAIEYAKQCGAVTIGFIGFGGGKLKGLVDLDITVSSKNYGQVEDLHLTLSHVLSQYLRQEISGATRKSDPTPIRATHDGMLRLFFSEPLLAGTSPAIFLDRDGIINERIEGGYVTDWVQFRFLENVQRWLCELSLLKLPIIVVSNQPCVGKGLMKESSLVEITQLFVSDLKSAGAQIDAVYYCLHTADQNCGCRKPQPGLLEQAAKDWKVDLRRSVLIGDSASDFEAAHAAHCRFILLVQPERSEAPSTWEILAPKEVVRVRRLSEIVANVRYLLRQCDEDRSLASPGSVDIPGKR